MSLAEYYNRLKEIETFGSIIYKGLRTLKNRHFSFGFVFQFLSFVLLALGE